MVLTKRWWRRWRRKEQRKKEMEGLNNTDSA